MISVIDYDGGNYKSVINILNKIKKEYLLTKNMKDILNSKSIILPGVSNFGYCIKSLKLHNLDEILREAVVDKKIKILGICSGMQSFASYSEESDTEGLNFIKGKVRKIDNDQYFRAPHMGWNKVNTLNNDLFKGIDNFTRFYFCHSYHFQPQDKNVISNYTNYKNKICAAIKLENIYGVQFHPEKSYTEGFQLIKNFIENCK